MSQEPLQMVQRVCSCFRAPVALLCLVAISLLLVGCGGGGGDGDSGGSNGGGGGNGGNAPPSLQFSADKSSVTFTYRQGQSPPPPQIVTITATGQYTGSLYVAAQMTGQGLSPVIPIAVTGTTATAQITAAALLPAGTYTGQLSLLACSDSACAHQIGNSPVTLSYTVTVTKILQDSPLAAAATAASGTPASQVVTVQLPDGQTAFSTAIQSGSPWLAITNVTASSFTIALASLPSGLYNGSVQVSSGSFSSIVSVSYTVTAPTGGDVRLAANPTSLTLASVENSTASATLGITPPSWNPPVTATAEYPSGQPSGWLTLTANGTGEQVVADASNLPAGAYTANIRLQGAYPSTDVVVPVAFTVGVGLMRPADVPVRVDAETTAPALSGSVPINVVAGPVIGWNGASDQPWLVLTQSSGRTGESLTYTIDQSALGALPDGAISTAHVTITPASATMTPVTFSLTLDKELPQVRSLAPYTQLTGQPARVILHGTGFSAIASLTGRLQLQGGTTNSVVLVNDTEVIAQFAPLSAGNHVVGFSNALGLTTSTGTVTAVAAPAYSYAAIPTQGSLRSLAYDAERDSIYAANVTTESIMSFHHSGSSWTTSDVLFAAAYDVGLTQNGTGLWATSNADVSGSAIRLLDPATLATQQSLSLPNIGLNPTFGTLGFGIQTTNDGRSWLAVGDFPAAIFAKMAYITPQSLNPTPLSIPLRTDFYDGPWYAMSRDGERLIITQTAAASPEPMLYMNAADSVLRINPAGLTFSYYFSLSETGDRVLFDNVELRDGAFNLIGAATLPTASPLSQSYYARAGLVTPDGSRVYVLAYRADAYANESTIHPRVFVFDAQQAHPDLTSLGYFDIADYAACAPSSNGSVACPTGSTIASAISLDGGTLFFAGNENLVVAPVPTTLTPVVLAPRSPVMNEQGRQTAATLW